MITFSLHPVIMCLSLKGLFFPQLILIFVHRNSLEHSSSSVPATSFNLITAALQWDLSQSLAFETSSGHPESSPSVAMEPLPLQRAAHVKALTAAVVHRRLVTELGIWC